MKGGEEEEEGRRAFIEGRFEMRNTPRRDLPCISLPGNDRRSRNPPADIKWKLRPSIYIRPPPPPPPPPPAHSSRGSTSSPQNAPRPAARRTAPSATRYTNGRSAGEYATPTARTLPLPVAATTSCTYPRAPSSMRSARVAPARSGSGWRGARCCKYTRASERDAASAPTTRDWFVSRAWWTGTGTGTNTSTRTGEVPIPRTRHRHADRAEQHSAAAAGSAQPA